MLTWASKRNIELHFVDPGELMQNGTVESSNASVRDECARIRAALPNGGGVRRHL